MSTSKFMVKAGGRRSSCFFVKYYCTFERRLMPFWRVQGGRMWGRQDAWPHCWVPVTTDTPRIWTCATVLQSDALWVNQHPTSFHSWYHIISVNEQTPDDIKPSQKERQSTGTFLQFYDDANIFDASMVSTTFFMTFFLWLYTFF